MGFYVSPGVYVREKDISEIIPNIATTSCALVGFSRKGSTKEIKLITNTRQFIEEYGYPTPGEYFHYTALAYLENGNTLYCLRVAKNALYAGAKIAVSGGSKDNQTLTEGKAEPIYYDEDEILFYVYAKDPGKWANAEGAIPVGVTITNLDATEKEFDIEVYVTGEDGVVSKVETWTVSRKHKLDGYGRQMYMEDRINGFSDYILVANDVSAEEDAMPKEQTTVLALGGGSDGDTITNSELTTGWDKFSNPDDVDVRILLNGGYASVAVQQKLKEIAESRKDCIAILDIPYEVSTNVTGMVTWRKTTQNFNSSYCALYAPWVKIYDPYNDKILEIPPSGYVGSQIAYNDYVAEPWYAPAGFNRGILNVLGLNKVFTQGERDVIYQAQINPLQTFRGEGNVIWGQKTEQVKASALDRVNVRRLLIVLEKSISAALRYFVFEPNNEITRFRITSTIESFLDLLSARGAFQRELGDRGYKVLCDVRNNPPAVIDRNELHVDIFIKPIRAAEFIQLQTIITQTGAKFEELIARGVQF